LTGWKGNGSSERRAQGGELIGKVFSPQQRGEEGGPISPGEIKLLSFFAPVWKEIRPGQGKKEALWNLPCLNSQERHGGHLA